MKYIKKYESHRSLINEEVEPVNEEILGAIGKFFGNMFKKVKERINKTKGGKEIEVIYQKYIKMINDEFTKTAKVDLNIIADEKAAADKAAADKKAAEAAKKPGAPVTAESRLVDFDRFSIINEEADVDAKTAVDNLKKKKGILEQIVKKLKDMAIKEMDNVIKKMGGASENPQLDMIIQSKKDQFDLDFMNAQISYLEKSGDTVMVKEIGKQRDAVSKKLEANFKDFDKAKPLKIEDGSTVIYLLKGKTKDDWNKLSDVEKQKPTEGKAKDIVGVKNIEKVDGDKIIFKSEDGKEIIKTKDEIVGAAPGEAVATPVDIKPGVSVVYKREKFDEKEWAKITDDDKKKPNEGKMKELQDKEMIGIKKVKELKGEDVSFEDADFTKKKDEILSGVEGAAESGEEDVAKTLGDVKTKNPEGYKKLNNIAKLYQEPDKNKAKIAEIEKQLGGEEGK